MIPDLYPGRHVDLARTQAYLPAIKFKTPEGAFMKSMFVVLTLGLSQAALAKGVSCETAYQRGMQSATTTVVALSLIHI